MPTKNQSQQPRSGEDKKHAASSLLEQREKFMIRLSGHTLSVWR